jgi:hypothetical protein
VRTVVDILNLQPGAVAPSDITLDGRIENPIGITNIRNQRGNVLADPDADVELIRTNEIHIEATGGSIGTVGGDANGAVGSTPRTPLAVELVRFQDATAPQLTPSMAPDTIFEPDLTAEATGDTVLDLYYMDRADDDLGGDFSQTAVIRKITAGDDVSVVVNDMREGIGETGLGVVTVADRGSTVDLRTVANHFRPDDVPGPDYANILRAFGTDFVEIDSTWVFSEVRAGDDIDIGHVTTTAAFGEPRSYATTSIGGTPYGATVTPETPNTTVNLVVNTDVAWTGGSSDDGVPQIFLTTNGDITATELIGDMLVGHIHSTAGDVTLISGRRILDADGLPTIDVTGVNITMTAGAVTPDTPNPTLGGIGTPTDFLEINVDRNNGTGVLNAFDTNAPSNGGIWISELVGDFKVDTVQSKADVSLRTVDGSIVDARNAGAGDDDANILARSVFLDANGVGAEHRRRWKRPGDRFGARAATASQGYVGLEAQERIHLTETAGALRLLLAHTYCGDIHITVRDSADSGENLELLHSGTVRFAESNNTAPGNHPDAPRVVPRGQIFAERGSIRLLVGDDVMLDANSEILAAGSIDIYGDVSATNGQIDPFANADPGWGTNMVLRGRIIAGADVTPGSPIGGQPVGTAIPTFTAPQY